MKRLLSAATLAAVAAAIITGQPPADTKLPTWIAAGHAAGRALVSPDGTLETLGYFTSIHDYPRTVMFSGSPSEQTARFTFRSTRSRLFTLPNNGIFQVNLLPLGTEQTLYRVYFETSPNQDFNRPNTFSDSTLIAEFAIRNGGLTVIPGSFSTYSATMDLKESSAIAFGGVNVNASSLVDAIRVTLHGPAVATPDEGQTSSIPFSGTVFAIRK